MYAKATHPEVLEGSVPRQHLGRRGLFRQDTCGRLIALWQYAVLRAIAPQLTPLPQEEAACPTLGHPDRSGGAFTATSVHPKRADITQTSSHPPASQNIVRRCRTMRFPLCCATGDMGVILDRTRGYHFGLPDRSGGTVTATSLCRNTRVPKIFNPPSPQPSPTGRGGKQPPTPR